jgi:hypothetical protein
MPPASSQKFRPYDFDVLSADVETTTFQSLSIKNTDPDEISPATPTP